MPEIISFEHPVRKWMDIEESKNPLNQHRVICSAIKNNTTQLWYFNEGTIKHHQTKGYLTKKYHGWIPSHSNIILQREHDYDIENVKYNT